MPSTIPTIMVAPCGMDCMVCYAHLKEKKPCSGCLCQDRNKPERCRSCAIKSCAADIGVAHCVFCDQFPCTRLKGLERSYQKRYGVSLLEQGRLVAEHGLEAFCQRDRERWTCTACGGVISLHDRVCSDCGGEV